MEVEKKGIDSTTKHYLSLTTCVCMLIILFQLSLINVGIIVGHSMDPTLDNGEIELEISSKLRAYKRGDIVTIQSSVLKKRIIKRIIAVEGDTVEITPDNKVYLNGELLDEPYINTIPEDFRMYYINLVVPEDKVFVMGDNRGNSVDSRYFGTVSEEEITSIYLGKIAGPKKIYRYIFLIISGIVFIYDIFKDNHDHFPVVNGVVCGTMFCVAVIFLKNL